MEASLATDAKIDLVRLVRCHSRRTKSIIFDLVRPTEQFRGRTKLRRPGFKARFGDQGRTEKFFYPNSDPKLAYWSTDATSQHTLALGLKNGWLSVWSFSAPVDINNDGTPLNVIIWQGYGATGVGKMCGTDYAGSTWQLSYINQRAFVLTADRKSIDETQTRLVFGAPRGVPRSVDPQLPGGNVKPGPNAFRPLADSVGIF